MRIHVTDRRTFKRCRRKWDLREYELKEATPNALWFGSGIHEVLAYFYKHRFSPTDPKGILWGRSISDGDPRHPKMSCEELQVKWQQYCQPMTQTIHVEKFQEMYQLGLEMLEEYWVYSTEHDKGWTVVAVEKELTAHVPGTRCTLVGTVDLVIWADGAYWIVDHKTAASFPVPTALEIDDQMSAYLWLATQNNIPVKGCVYNVLRKKIPTEPTVLVAGGLSRAKNIDTTARRYRRRIEQLDLDPDDYKDILATLEGNEFVQRTQLARSKRWLKVFEEDLTFECRGMSSKLTRCYPNPTQDCQWDCSYMPGCRSMQEDGDYAFILDQLYDHTGGRK